MIAIEVVGFDGDPTHPTNRAPDWLKMKNTDAPATKYAHPS
jgi:hypothetical protein